MLRHSLLRHSLLLLAALPAAAQAAPPRPTSMQLPAADQAAAFRAAGFKFVGGKWRACGDPGTATYSPGTIDSVADRNGDGLPDAVITEGGTYCFGMTGAGYALVSKRANGKWRLMSAGTGILTFLATRGVGGWPDIEIGGPGFCFPVERWNGAEYVPHRHQYEGKRCQPPAP